MSASLSGEFNLQAFTDLGDPLIGGRLYTYTFGTTAHKTAYTDHAGTIPHTYTSDGLGGQYIALNARGELSAPLYLVGGSYDLSLKRADGSTVWTRRADPVWDLVSDFTSGGGAAMIGYTPAGTGAVATTAQEKFREAVSVLDYSSPADRNATYLAPGTVDLTYAAQAATSTGYPVEFPSGWTFKITGVTHSGKVVWFSKGGATIVSDGSILSATNAADSVIDNLTLNNITAPWIVIRNPLNWAANVLGTLQQSNIALGYMPTVNDTDLWASLTLAQKNQTVSPTITLDGSDNITVSRIKGRFAVVIVKNAIDSVIRDCNIRGGKSTYGALVFDNSATQNGIGNRAINNKVRYSANNGVCFLGNSDFDAIGNNCSRNGESGVKTYQNAGFYNYRGNIAGNNCNENYYDGIDAASSYPYATTILTYHNIVGNRCYRNGGTGLNVDGQGNNVEANHLYFNYKNGILAVCMNSLIGSNKLVDNNQLRSASTHEIVVDVAGVANNTIIGNKIWSGAGANSSAIYAPSESVNYIANNFAKGSSFFFGNPGSIKSVCENNIDDTTGLQTTQRFSFTILNNGAILQHLVNGEGNTGGYGSKSSRISNSSAALTTTPTGADASTAFAAGAKISSEAQNTVILDTSAQTMTAFEGAATVEYNDTGTPLIVRAGNQSLNVNGVTRSRLTFQLFNANTGAPFALTTANIPNSKAVVIGFMGKVA